MRTITKPLVFFGLVLALGACGEPASNLTVEALPEVSPNIPSVPQIPARPVPSTYADGSYSIDGARYLRRNTNNTEISMTGYLVKEYVPPECEGNRDDCPRVSAPHWWIADARGEQDQAKLLRVTGYTDQHEVVAEAKEQGARGRYEPPPEGMGTPIPWDFAVGQKIKVTGRFASMSQVGFNDSRGLMDYARHEMVEAAPGAE